MKVTVDEQARHIRIEADDTSPGARVDYWDGSVAPLFTGKIYSWMDQTIVEQFVRFTPTRVEVGWRDLDGELQHYAAFVRPALYNKSATCRWHVFSALGRG